MQKYGTTTLHIDSKSEEPERTRKDSEDNFFKKFDESTTPVQNSAIDQETAVKIEYVRQESKKSENNQDIGQLNIEGALKSWNDEQQDKPIEKIPPTSNTNITDALNLGNIGKVQELKLEEEEDKMQTSTTSVATNGSDNSAKFMRNVLKYRPKRYEIGIFF